MKVSVSLAIAFAALLALASIMPVASAAAPTSADLDASTRMYLVRLSDDANLGAFLAAHDIDPSYRYEYALTGFAAELSDAEAASLRSSGGVLYVTEDRPVSIMTQSLPTGVRRINATQNILSKIDGIDERVDVGVAIVDTGIDFLHPDLNVNRTHYKNCITNGTMPQDDHFHGTHVGGTVGALDNDFGVVGLAPGANLFAVKVLNAGGAGTWASVACGIDWVTAHADIVDVASMSLGGSGSDDGNCGYTNGDVLHQAVCRAVDAGVVIVVAAGNSARDASAFAPASYDEVITVSAMADFDGLPGGLGSPTCRVDQDDTLADFSNFGADVDVGAPGVCINSTMLGGGYAVFSGTSMATPHVSGVAALYILEHGKPTNRTGVDAVRAGIIADGFPQNSSMGFSGDKDSLPEPVANGNASVSGPAPLPPPPVPPDPPGTVHDIAVLSAKVDKTEVVRGHIVSISGTVKNEGTMADSFYVRAYAGNARVDIDAVLSLASGASKTVFLVWRTGGFAYGTYEVTLEAVPVTNETDIADNVRHAGTVTVVSGEVPNYAPSITFIEPANNSTVGGRVSVFAVVQDDRCNLQSVAFFIDGKRILQSGGTCYGNVTYSWNTRKYQDGVHELSIVAYDGSIIGYGKMYVVTENKRNS